jgi:3'-5' exoribonuclease
MGHIVQGVMLIDRKCAEIASETGKPFPEALKTAIVHLVLSHHGSYEFGSPRLPAMPEAIALHHLDNLDAKVNQFTAAIDGDSDEKSEWTEYVPSLSTRVYKRRDWSGE